MKKQGRPWSIAKGFDASAPIGPIHPKAVVGELTKGAVTLDVNGQRRQSGDLTDLIWSVNETIAALSRAWTLAPGDLIFTGTPAGVGAVIAGDVLTGAIDGLGQLQLAIV
jgi:fumarylpyruvate hydrolase